MNVYNMCYVDVLCGCAMWMCTIVGMCYVDVLCGCAMDVLCAVHATCMYNVDEKSDVICAICDAVVMSYLPIYVHGHMISL